MFLRSTSGSRQVGGQQVCGHLAEVCAFSRCHFITLHLHKLMQKRPNHTTLPRSPTKHSRIDARRNISFQFLHRSTLKFSEVRVQYVKADLPTMSDICIQY